METLGCTTEVLPVTSLGTMSLPLHQLEDWRRIQHDTLSLKYAINSVEIKQKPTRSVSEDPEICLLLQELNKLVIKEGILHRTTKDSLQNTLYQLILPAQYRKMTLKALHDNVGHVGMEKTLVYVRTRFYWPRMMQDVQRKCKNCA